VVSILEHETWFDVVGGVVAKIRQHMFDTIRLYDVREVFKNT